jgi:hypothetical protein
VKYPSITIQCTERMDEYILITERGNSNILDYQPMKVDDIQRALNMFFTLSRWEHEKDLKGSTETTKSGSMSKKGKQKLREPQQALGATSVMSG